MDAQAATAGLDWADIEARLDQEGYAVLPGLLTPAQARELAALRGADATDRRDLASEDLGEGELAYLPKMPPLVADLRSSFYRRLAPIATRWSEALGSAYRYPDTLDSFLTRNRNARQTRPLSNLTLLREGGYQALHQRAGEAHVFAFQLCALLSEPGKDFTGGEFVMVEQRPRMQSRPMVLPLNKSDVAIIACAHRPHRGSKGYYRVTLKHAVSRVRSGERLGLDLLFHDAGPDAVP